MTLLRQELFCIIQSLHLYNDFLLFLVSIVKLVRILRRADCAPRRIHPFRSDHWYIVDYVAFDCRYPQSPNRKKLLQLWLGVRDWWSGKNDSEYATSDRTVTHGVLKELTLSEISKFRNRARK